MLALVLFSSSVALLMYSKQNDVNSYLNESIEVIITNKHLHKGDMITGSDVTTTRLPKTYISYTPLTKAEIVGRYTKFEIFKNEPLNPAKLSLVKPEEKAKVPQAQKPVVKNVIKKIDSDTISMSLNLFQNMDSSLKQGDFIDIVSVLPKKLKNKDYSFKTKYIALHIPIHNFMSKGKSVKTLVSQKYDENEKLMVVTADTVVLEMKPSEIKNFLASYYLTQELNSNRVYTTKEKTGHLWIVKCSPTEDKKLNKQKEKLMINAKAKKRKRAAKKVKVDIAYED